MIVFLRGLECSHRFLDTATSQNISVASFLGLDRDKARMMWAVIGNRETVADLEAYPLSKLTRLAESVTVELRWRFLGGAKKKQAKELLDEARKLIQEKSVSQAIKKYRMAELAAENEGDDETRGTAQLEAGNVFEESGRFFTALKWYKRFLAMAEHEGNSRWKAGAYAHLANAYWGLRKYDTAIDFYEKNLEMTLEIGDRQMQSSIYNHLGRIYWGTGQRAKGLDYLEKHLAIEVENGDHAAQYTAYSGLSSAYISIQQYEKAIEYAEKSVEMAEVLGDGEKIFTAHSGLGNAYLVHGELGKGIACHEKHLEFALKSNDRKGQLVAYGNLGAVHKVIGNFDKAIECFETCLSLAEELGEHAAQGTVYGNLGNLYQSLGQYEKAIQFLEKHRAISIELGDRAGEARVYGNLSNVCLARGMYDKGIEYANTFVAISLELGDRAGEGAGLGTLGNLYLSVGQYHKAMQCHEKHLAIAKAMGDRQGLGAAYGSLGTVYQCLGQYRKAIECHEKRLTIAVAVGNRLEQCSVYINLGNAYWGLGQLNTAIEYHEKSLATAQEIRDRESECAAWGNLGSVFQTLRQPDKAIECFQRALSIAKELGRRGDEGRIYGNLGLVHIALGKHHEGIELCEKQLAIAAEVGDRPGQGRANGALASACVAVAQFDKAILYSENFLAIAEEVGDRTGLGAAYALLGSAYVALGDYPQAIEYQEKLLAISLETGDVDNEKIARNLISRTRAKLASTNTADDRPEHQKKQNVLADNVFNDLCGRFWAACRRGDLQDLRAMRSEICVSGAFGSFEATQISDATDDTSTPVGNTGLHYAARAGHLAVVDDLLVEWQVLVDAENSEFQTPYQLALVYGFPTVAKRLRDAGAAPFLPQKVFDAFKARRFTEPNAAGSESLKLAWNGLFNAMQVDIEDSRGTDPYGRTTLHLSAFRGHCEYVKAALGQPHNVVDPCAKDNEGWTALHWAAASSGLSSERAVDVCSLLLDKCPELAVIRDSRNRTPLDVAKSFMNVELSTYLQTERGLHSTPTLYRIGRILEYVIAAIGRGLYFPAYVLSHAFSAHSTGSILRGDDRHFGSKSIAFAVSVLLLALGLFWTIDRVPEESNMSPEDARESASHVLVICFGLQALYVIWNVVSAVRARSFFEVKHVRYRLRFKWRRESPVKTEKTSLATFQGLHLPYMSDNEHSDDLARSRSVKNALDILGMGVSFVSLQSYAFVPQKIREYHGDILSDELRTLSNIFSAGVLTFGVDTFRTVFWSAVSVALLWFLFASHIFTATRILRSKAGSWLRLRYGFVQEDFFARLPAPHVLIPLLSDTLFLPIITKLIQGLSCTYHDVPDAELVADPSILCWRGEHVPIASTALIVSLYYLLTTTTVSVYFSEAQDDSSDVRTIPAFIVCVRSLEWTQAVVGTFFSEYAYVAIGSSLVISLTLALLVWRWQPVRCVWSVNHWRFGMYLAIVWSALCSAIALVLEDPENIAPFVLFVCGWSAIMVYFSWKHYSRMKRKDA